MSRRKTRLGSICVTLLTALFTVQSTTVKYSIYEEGAPGTEIGTLSQDLGMEPPLDPQTSFRFMDEANSSVIHMRAIDGLVTVREIIDRETLCAESPRCLISFDVVVSYEGKYRLVQVEIEVKDNNDHSPHFPHNETYLEMSESVPVGTRFPLDIATDQDVGNNYVQTYQVSSNSHFGIEVRTREDGVKHAELVLLQGMDREAEGFYSIQVSATDGGSPPRSGSMTVHIKVLDSNDNSPRFERSSLKVDLNEDAPVGFLLLKVQAFDPDEGVNGELLYGFVEESSAEIKRLFQIDPFSGAVTLKAAVDYESRRSYELSIQACDLGVNAVPSTCSVTVEVVDVNDNAPEIRVKPMTSSSDGVAYVTEAAAEESFVALIRTSDRDSGSNGKVRVTLHGHEHFKLQQAYGDAFMVVTTTTLDREKVPEYNLTVVAEDLGSPPYKTIKQYTIRVSDENDNAPVFSKSVYEVSVLENNSPRSYITTVVARDLDMGDNGKVDYKLIDGEAVGGVPLSTLVSVNPLSGSLYTMQSFNYESVKLMEVNIQATDRGFPQLSSTATIRIKIVDQNDNAPYITYPVLHNDSAEVAIPYNAPRGYLALRLQGGDADEGPNGELSFRIVEDKRAFFTMNRESGDMILKHGLTLTCGELLEVKIAVTDKGRAPLSRSATVRFIVTEMQPSEDRLTVPLQSHDEEEPGLDLSLVAIIVLGGGCALLLVAIMTVALSCRRDPKDRAHADRERAAPSLLQRGSRGVHSSQDSNVSSEAGCLVNNRTTSSLNDSTCLYEERSEESETKMFLPSKCFGPRSLCTKPSLEQASVRPGRKHSSSQRGPGSADQLSVEDSGRGDSDFTDSGSDFSDRSSPNPRTSHPPENGTSHPASTLAMAQKPCVKPCVKPFVIQNHPSAFCTNGYAIAFSHTPVYSRAWNDRGYGPNVPRAADHSYVPNIPKTDRGYVPNIPKADHGYGPNVTKADRGYAINVPKPDCGYGPNIPKADHCYAANVPVADRGYAANVPKADGSLQMVLRTATLSPHSSHQHATGNQSDELSQQNRGLETQRTPSEVV